MRRWYASPPMDRLAALRKLYNDAGVNIHIAKFSPGTDPVASEFAFRAAHALGARGCTNEISEEACRVQGPVAARYGLSAAMHNHGQPSDPDFPGFDHFLAISPGVSLNFDFGHYYGYTGESPVPEIVRLSDRITSFHMKDKAAPPSPGVSGDNLPWGQGTTPIADVLRLDAATQRQGRAIFSGFTRAANPHPSCRQRPDKAVSTARFATPADVVCQRDKSSWNAARTGCRPRSGRA